MHIKLSDKIYDSESDKYNDEMCKQIYKKNEEIAKFLRIIIKKENSFIKR